MHMIRYAILLTCSIALLGCRELQTLRAIREKQDLYIKELEKRNAEYQETYYTLVTQRNTEAEQFRERIGTLEREVAQLKDVHTEREKALADANQELKQTLQEKLREAAQNEAQLNQRIVQLRNEATEKEKEVSGLREARAGLEQQIAQVKQVVTEREATIGQIKAESEALQNKLNERDETIAKQNERIGSIESELTTKKNLEKALQEQIRDYESKLEAQQATQEEMDKAKKRLEELNKQLETLKKGQPVADAQLDAAREEIQEALSTAIQNGDVEVASDARGVVVRLPNDFLFEPRSVIVSSQGRKVLDALAEIFKKYSEHRLVVQGHTDDQPVLDLPFPDNWGLSSQRANNVIRYLIERGGIDPKRLTSVACSMFQPIVSNATPEGRAKNRRVEIIETR
jgi:chemotaxis protein MotB